MATVDELLNAIHENCIYCYSKKDQRREETESDVENCNFDDCSLFPYRNGKDEKNC